MGLPKGDTDDVASSVAMVELDEAPTQCQDEDERPSESEPAGKAAGDERDESWSALALIMGSSSDRKNMCSRSQVSLACLSSEGSSQGISSQLRSPVRDSGPP